MPVCCWARAARSRATPRASARMMLETKRNRFMSSPWLGELWAPPAGAWLRLLRDLRNLDRVISRRGEGGAGRGHFLLQERHQHGVGRFAVRRRDVELALRRQDPER